MLWQKVLLGLVTVGVWALVAIGGMTVTTAIQSQPRVTNDLDHRCYANGESVMCVFSNVNPWPITGCIVGVVTKKDGAEGLKVKSQPVCTGSLAAYETKMVTAYWAQGRPADLCPSDSAFGIKGVDWDGCEFRSDEIVLGGGE